MYVAEWEEVTIKIIYKGILRIIGIEMAIELFSEKIVIVFLIIQKCVIMNHQK